MSERKALVTGGAGFIGAHLVGYLLKEGLQVRVLDIASKPDFMDDQVEYIQGSVLDREQVQTCIDDVDWVFHLAANPHLWAKDTYIFEQINYQGTQVVLEAAKQANISLFIHTSTEAILRSYLHPTTQLITENTPLPAFEEMAGPYTRSKYLADQAVYKAHEAGLPVIIVYPTGPIGTNDPNLTAPNKMIADFLKEKTPAYLECNLNLIAVEDVAQGIVHAAQVGRVGERYILGNENLALSEILQHIHKIFDKKVPKRRIPYTVALLTAHASEFISNTFTYQQPIASLEGVRLAKANLIFDCQKAQKELEMPQTPIREVIEKTGNWLIQQGYVD